MKNLKLFWPLEQDVLQFWLKFWPLRQVLTAYSFDPKFWPLNQVLTAKGQNLAERSELVNELKLQVGGEDLAVRTWSQNYWYVVRTWLSGQNLS